MPRLLLTLTALTTAIVVTAGCGSEETGSSDASSLAPGGSLVYAEATLRPEGDQRAAIERLVSRFPGDGSAGERVQGLMEKAFAEAETSLSYSEDIEPWLGDDAAFFMSGVGESGEDADAAFLVATEDEDATVDAIEKEGDAEKTDHRGHDVYVSGDEEGAAAVVEGWLVLGTPRAVEAAIETAEDGKPIEDDERYRETLEEAPGDRLGFVYVNMPGFLEELGGRAAPIPLGPVQQLFEEPILVTADADEAGVRFEGTIPTSLLAGFPILSEGSGAGELPADSWLALAQPDLGDTIDSYVDLAATALGGRDVVERWIRSETGLDLQEDITSWMGEWSVFVRGESVDDINGAMVVQSDDEEASERFLDRIAVLARRNADPGTTIRPLELPGGGEGFTMRSSDVPHPFHLFQRDGRVVTAFGDDAAQDALDPGETLSSTADYAQAEEALGGDYAVSFYMALQPVLALIESTGAASDPEYLEVKPYLEPLGALVGGAREDGDDLRSAFALTVK
jgi:hypothetical protein